MTVRRVPPAALAALALTACGHSAPTTLYSLAPSPPSTPFGGYAGSPVRVDAVRLPPAIDRIEMLRETSRGRFAVREFDRWAAPPGRLARQALVEDLALRLPGGAVLAPGDKGDPPLVTVSVNVLSFSAGPGSASLVGSWKLGCDAGVERRRGELNLEGPPGETPEALGRMLAQAADLIAADLRALPVRCPPAETAGQAQAVPSGIRN